MEATRAKKKNQTWTKDKVKPNTACCPLRAEVSDSEAQSRVAQAVTQESESKALASCSLGIKVKHGITMSCREGS